MEPRLDMRKLNASTLDASLVAEPGEIYRALRARDGP
jgi:hypothetical protein